MFFLSKNSNKNNMFVYDTKNKQENFDPTKRCEISKPFFTQYKALLDKIGGFCEQKVV